MSWTLRTSWSAGSVECNLVSPEDNRGGGGEYGIKGSIPGLVR